MNKINLFAELPCPIKQAFREKFNEMNLVHYHKTGQRFKAYIPNVLGSEMRKNYLLSVEDEDNLPEIYLGYLFGDVSDSLFVEKYLASAVYSPFKTIAYFVEVLLANSSTVDVPQSWEELLDDKYKGRICTFGANNIPDYVLPITIYKKYGINGVATLFSNIKQVISPVEISRKIGTSKISDDDIYIMPYIFASICAEKPSVKLTIPCEGVLVEPLVMIRKTNSSSEMCEWLYDNTVTELFEKNNFPVPGKNNDVLNKVNFVGFDFVLNQNINAIKKEIFDLASKYFN